MRALRLVGLVHAASLVAVTDSGAVVRAEAGALAAAEAGALAEVNASMQDWFMFEIHNGATVALNIVAIPKAVGAYASARNKLMPGETWEFRGNLIAYEFTAVIDDGHNRWDKDQEQRWGLTKDGVRLSMSIGGGVLTGAAAAGAVAGVAALMSVVAAPAALVVLASYATFFGVTAFSTMATSAITQIGVEKVEEAYRDVFDHAPKLGVELDGAADDVLGFDGVVKGRVHRSVRKAYSIDTEKLWLSTRSARQYLQAMNSRMDYSALVAGRRKRRLVITGGFLAPSPCTTHRGKYACAAIHTKDVEDVAPPASDVPCTAPKKAAAYMTEWCPLEIGEASPTFGCTKGQNWQEELPKCKEGCVDSARDHYDISTLGILMNRAKWPKEAEADVTRCERECAKMLEKPLAASEVLEDRKSRAEQLVGGEAYVLERLPRGAAKPETARKGDLLEAESDNKHWRVARVVEVKSDTVLVHYAGFSPRHDKEYRRGSSRLRRVQAGAIYPRQVHVKKVAGELAVVEDSRGERTVDLADVSPDQNGPPFGPAPRSFGRCWSRCETTGIHTALRAVTPGQAHCASAPGGWEARGRHQAAVCTSDQDCSLVGVGGWACTETCC